MAGVRVSLRIKFTVLVILFATALLLFSSVITGFTVLNRNQAFVARALLTDAVQLLEYFSETVSDALVLEDDILLVNTFNKIKRMDNIDYAVLYSRDGAVLLHSEVFARRDTAWESGALRELENRTNITVIPEFNPADLRNAYTVGRSFRNRQGRLLGTLSVRYSTGQLENLVRQIRDTLLLNMGVIFAVSLLLAVLFGFLLARRTLRPVRQLADGMEVIGGGNMEYVLPVRGNDEIAFLSENVNAMTARIREAQKSELDRQRQQEQMMVAKKIQEAIFPEKPLATPRYEIASFTLAAKLIGGDYHYYLAPDPDHPYFIVADVSGKGVPAALITFMISTVVNTLIENEKKYDAGFILSETNRILVPELMKVGQFATALLAFYEARSGALDFVSAGHGDLFVYRAARGGFDRLKNVHFPLGIDPDTAYQSLSVSLDPGDMVLVITDGVSEAKNEQEAEYGVKRLLELPVFGQGLPAVELVAELKKKILEFVGDAETYDDMTVLVFRRLS